MLEFIYVIGIGDGVVGVFWLVGFDGNWHYQVDVYPQIAILSVPVVSTHEPNSAMGWWLISGEFFRVNVCLGPIEERELISGLHTVNDIYCSSCQQILGWKYVSSEFFINLLMFCIMTTHSVKDFSDIYYNLLKGLLNHSVLCFLHWFSLEPLFSCSLMIYCFSCYTAHSLEKKFTPLDFRILKRRILLGKWFWLYVLAIWQFLYSAF